MVYVLPYRRVRGGAALLALALAFAAQYLFTGEILTHTQDSFTWEWLPRYSFGLALLTAAIGCAAWSFLGENAPAIAEPSAASALVRGRLLLLAFGGYGFAIVRYLTSGEDLAMQVAWVMGALLLPIALWSPAGWRLARPLRRWEPPALLCIIVLALWLRYWRLTEIPEHVENDVALMGTFARGLIAAGDYRWIGFSASEHLLSYDQLHAWSMRLFGNNHYGLVLISMIAGTLTVPAVYLLGRAAFGPGVALVAAAVLAINYTHIHFSRIMFGPVTTLAATLAFLGLLLGTQTRRPHWFALGGLATGFGLLQYDSSRVVPVIALGLFAWDLAAHRRTLRQVLMNWAIYAAGTLLAFGPMLAYMLREFETFVGRGNRVGLWNPLVWEHVTGIYKTDSLAVVLFEQSRRTFLSLHLYGDGSPHFALQRPMVSPLAASLLALGAGICVRRLRDPRYALLVLWIVCTFVLGGVITYDPPYWPHLNIALPAIVLVAGLGATLFWQAATLIAGRAGSIGARLALAGLLIFTGIHNWQIYVDYSAHYADARIRVARYIAEQSPGYTVYIVGDAFRWDDYTFVFFNQDVPGQNIALDELRAEPPPLDRPLLFVLYQQPEELAFLQERYPGGIVETREQRGPLITYYRVAPDGQLPTASATHTPIGWVATGAAIGGGASLLHRRVRLLPRMMV